MNIPEFESIKEYEESQKRISRMANAELFDFFDMKNTRTNDGEWESEELEGIIYDECKGFMTDEVLNKYKHRALINENLLKYPYMCDKISAEVNVLDLYNECGDIEGFCDRITDMVHKKLEDNLYVK